MSLKIDFQQEPGKPNPLNWRYNPQSFASPSHSHQWHHNRLEAAFPCCTCHSNITKGLKTIDSKTAVLNRSGENIYITYYTVYYTVYHLEVPTQFIWMHLQGSGSGPVSRLDDRDNRRRLFRLHIDGGIPAEHLVPQRCEKNIGKVGMWHVQLVDPQVYETNCSTQNIDDVASSGWWMILLRQGKASCKAQGPQRTSMKKHNQDSIWQL